jgi:hypothetical protein
MRYAPQPLFCLTRRNRTPTAGPRAHQPFRYSPSKFPRRRIPIPSPIIHRSGEAKAGPGRSAVRPPVPEMKHRNRGGHRRASASVPTHTPERLSSSSRVKTRGLYIDGVQTFVAHPSVMLFFQMSPNLRRRFPRMEVTRKIGLKKETLLHLAQP